MRDNWKISTDKHGFRFIETDEGELTLDGSLPDGEIDLIVNAPELLQSSILLLTFLEGVSENGYDPMEADKHIEKLNDVIEKIKGGTK